MQYDRNKQYSWGPNDKFEISGAELGMVSKFLRAMLSTEEAAKILLAQQTNIAIESIIARGVEEGTIKEIVQPEPNSKPEEAIPIDRDAK